MLRLSRNRRKRLRYPIAVDSIPKPLPEASSACPCAMLEHASFPTNPSCRPAPFQETAGVYCDASAESEPEASAGYRQQGPPLRDNAIQFAWDPAQSVRHGPDRVWEGTRYKEMKSQS